MVKDSSNGESTLKFLCSYGGRILPRKIDGKLRYVGGYTRVLAVDRSISYAELMVKLGEFCGSSVRLKCQLPDGELDTLVSVVSDEDLANVVEEYDKASSSSPSSSPLKIRAILSPPKSLKYVSPPMSSSASVADFSAYKTPSVTTAGGFRSHSAPVGYPIGYRDDSANVWYHHHHHQSSHVRQNQNPRFMYFVPQTNQWQ